MKTKSLSLEPKILAMAAGLQLPGKDPVEGILEFCRRRVSRLIRRGHSLLTIWDFERVICEHLNLVIHEIWNDHDLESFSSRYARDEGDPTFASLGMQLEGESFGVLFQRRTRTPNGEFQYVAFIDCRGQKAAKRFFTRWHEIAHCLTTYEQFVFPFRRAEKDPIEKMMDMIAGELAFFDPIFRPILKEASLRQGRLSFNLIEGIRQDFCPDASFQATLNACLIKTDVPTLLVEAKLGLKKAEQLALRCGQISSAEATRKECLRVINCMQNPAAVGRGLLIPWQMRVPTKSIISEAFHKTDHRDIDLEAIENLKMWKSSTGNVLPDINVLVQARKFQQGVFALISELQT